jgi:ubiquinone/menaquinone biosynthesis C-methylase UbiE
MGGTRVYSFETARIFPLLKEVALEASRVLEVGAGDGRMMRLLQAEGAQGQFYASDIRLRQDGLQIDGI